LKDLNLHFYNDFINPETKETDFLTMVERIKNFKDFIHKKLNLKILPTNLQDISPYLANFSVKGIELFG